MWQQEKAAARWPPHLLDGAVLLQGQWVVRQDGVSAGAVVVRQVAECRGNGC